MKAAKEYYNTRSFHHDVVPHTEISAALDFMTSLLPGAASFLDVGCGDGDALVHRSGSFNADELLDTLWSAG